MKKIIFVIIALILFGGSSASISCGDNNGKTEGTYSESAETKKDGLIVNILPCSQYTPLAKCKEFEPAEEVLVLFFKTIQKGWKPGADQHLFFPAMQTAGLDAVLNKISQGKGLRQVDIKPDREIWEDSETGLLKAMFFYSLYTQNGYYHRSEVTVVKTNEGLWKIKTLLD